MNKLNKVNRSKGFTLVEIMIVLVVIGLLAAMAIPSYQSVRESARDSTTINDARQLASAAQQYMSFNTATSVAVNYDKTTGGIGGDLGQIVSQISKGYDSVPTSIDMDSDFTLTHPQGSGSLIFGPDGQLK